MSKAKRLLPLLLVGGLIGWLLVSDEPAREATPLEARGLSLQTYTASAEPSWELRATSGIAEGAQSDLSDVTIDFHSSPDGPLTAQAGRLSRSQQMAHLSEGVVVERADGFRLETETLRWNEGANSLESGPVDLTLGDLHATAEVFRYDLHASRAILEEDVMVELTSDRSFRATGERGEQADGLFALEGHVTIEGASGETYRCRRVDVEPSTENAKPTIRLSGDVEAMLPSGRLSADRLVLSARGVTAEGAVSLRLNDLGEGGPLVP